MQARTLRHLATAIVLGVAALVLIGAPPARAAGGWSSPIEIGSGAGRVLVASACPTPQDCVLVDAAGHSDSFNPQTPHYATGSFAVDGPARLDASMSCPSTGLCAIGTTDGAVWTFDPRARGHAHAYALGTAHPTAVSCASTSECTAVGFLADGVDTVATSFDPQTQAIERVQKLGLAATAVSCPRAWECVAVGPGSHGSGTSVVRFDPNGSVAAARPITRATTMSQIACPSPSQCTAIDTTGAQATFDPGAPGRPTLVAIGARSVGGLVCPGTGDCLTVSGTSVLEGNPQLHTRWSTSRVDPQALTSLACADAAVCVAGDAAGAVVTRPVPGLYIPLHASTPSHASTTTTLPVGKVTVDSLTVTHTGVDIKVTCRGSFADRCVLVFELSGGVSHGYAAYADQTMIPRTRIFHLALGGPALARLREYGYFYAYLKILQKWHHSEPAVLGQSFKMTAG